MTPDTPYILDASRTTESLLLARSARHPLLLQTDSILPENLWRRACFSMICVTPGENSGCRDSGRRELRGDRFPSFDLGF